MKRFFVTFGCGQPYHNKYVVVWATTEDRARQMMNRAHGNMWSMIYQEENWKKTSMSKNYTRLGFLMENDVDVEWGFE